MDLMEQIVRKVEAGELDPIEIELLHLYLSQLPDDRRNATLSMSLENWMKGLADSPIQACDQ